jgi:hypothetical protein
LNERIKSEILTRLEKARAGLPDLPDSLKPLLGYYEGQSVVALARELARDLEDTFEIWGQGEAMQAAGFEWYYDGTDLPDALGYAFKEIKTPPDLSGIPIGSDTHKARADFDGGVQFENMMFGDSGWINLPAACFPFYECQVAELEPEADDEWDALENLFTLRLFYCLHLALGYLSRSGAFSKLKLTTPFYLFANNHDWSPFLVFRYDNQPVSGDEYDLAGAGVTRVESLSDWVNGIAALSQTKETRETLLSSMSRKSPAEMEAILLRLPELKRANADPIVLVADELKAFASQTISDPAYCEQISFEALQHLFELTLAKRKANLYDIHAALIYLFVNRAERAFEYVTEVMDRYPKKRETILDCAKNSLRWAGEDPEHRWPNPNLALSKSAGARQAMERLLAS